MPKGGDLHNHLSGAVFAEWWYELALAQQERGYEYYTKVRIGNCRDFGGNAFARDPYLLLFRTISALEYAQLDPCDQDVTRDPRAHLGRPAPNAPDEAVSAVIIV